MKQDAVSARDFFQNLRWQKTTGQDEITAVFNGQMPESAWEYLAGFQSGKDYLYDEGEAKTLYIKNRALIEDMVASFDIDFTGKSDYQPRRRKA